MTTDAQLAAIDAALDDSESDFASRLLGIHIEDWADIRDRVAGFDREMPVEAKASIIAAMRVEAGFFESGTVG